MNRLSILKQTFAISFLLMAGTVTASAGLVVELSSEASRPANNDLAQATVSAEATGATPGELSRQINNAISHQLKTAKGYPAVKAKTSGTSTYPVYAKNGKIESWRMRSDISLESGDTAALSELLGKLQASLGVSSLNMLPAPETRRKAENEAMLDAIALFKARSKLLAEAMGKNYSITHLTVSTGGRFAQPVMRASRAMSAEAAVPMPMESGESLVTVSVSGKIEIE
ncbi:MAG: SIMPL domain-containing protein [Propionivibrio sp.]